MDAIFFKDANGAVKGPFTEREVQEWYRKGWFDSKSPFYFMSGGETPTDDTPSLTLGELQLRYGIGCPFSRMGEDHRAREIEEMEKKAAEMQQEIDQMLKMERRVKELEDQLKILEASPSTATTSSGDKATVEKTSKNELEEATSEDLPNWIPRFVGFFLDAYEALATNTDPTTYWISPGLMHPVGMKIRGNSAKPFMPILLRELKKAIKAKEYLFCAPCGQILQNYKLTFLHLTDPQHEAKAVAKYPIWEQLTDTLVDFFDINLATSWLQEENALIEANSNKFLNIPLNSPRLRPSLDFLRLMQTRNEELRSRPNGTKFDLFAHHKDLMIKIQGDLGKKIMSELEEHIGHKPTITRCLPCGGIFGSATEYYEHLLGPGHMSRVSPLDVLTLVVNAHKKNLVK